VSNKVAQLNLEEGMPKVDAAVLKMKNALTTFKGQGYRAVIIIHGYGSTGVGGSIKTAVRNSLSENSMRGIVRTYAGGEQWSSRKKELLSICRDLDNYESRIISNEGITVVILR
jgi:predicted esterase